MADLLETWGGTRPTGIGTPPASGGACQGGMAHNSLCIGWNARSGVGNNDTDRAWTWDGHINGRAPVGVCGHGASGGWLMMIAHRVDENCATFYPTMMMGGWANEHTRTSTHLTGRMAANASDYSVRLCREGRGATTRCDPQRLGHERYAHLRNNNPALTEAAPFFTFNTSNEPCGAFYTVHGGNDWGRADATVANLSGNINWRRANILVISDWLPSGNGAWVRVANVQSHASAVALQDHGTRELGELRAHDTEVRASGATFTGRSTGRAGETLVCKDGFRPEDDDCVQVASAELCRRGCPIVNGNQQVLNSAGSCVPSRQISREQMYFGTGGVDAPIDNQCWQKMTPDEFKRCVMPPTSGT